MQDQRRKPLLGAILSVIVALIGCSAASDAHGEAAVFRTERELETKCTCSPCGHPCYPSPPPPSPSPPPPPPPVLPHPPPRPFCPPPPLPPSLPCQPYCWFGSPGKLYPIDSEYLPSGAGGSCMEWWFPALVPTGLLLLMWF